MIVMPELHSGWKVGASYQVGTAAVSAYAKKMGHHVICLNLNSKLNKQRDTLSSAEIVYNFVKKHNPDVVAVGSLVLGWESVKEICDMARAAKPDVVIIIGGGLVTYSPEEAMRLIGVADYGIIGEGEVTMHELLTALETGKSVEGIAGLIYRDGSRGLVTSQKRDDISDLDSLPFLDYEGFDLFDEIRRTKSLAIVSSRSCPFGCTYCTPSGGSRYRQRSLDHMFAEIGYVLSQVPDVRTISICDELFAINKERLEQFIQRISSCNFDWALPIRADSIMTPEIFKKAYAAGCTVMQVGLESGCDAILNSMRKGTSKSMVKNLYQIASECDIIISSGLIFGDVAETMETVEESFSFAKELQDINPRAEIQVVPIKLYPGAHLYNDARDSKKIADSTKFIFNNAPLVNVSKMTDEEYNFLVKRIIPAMNIVQVFVRPAIGQQKAPNYQRNYQQTIEDDLFVKSYAYLSIADIDLDEKVYYLSYVCPKCNTKFYTVTKDLTYGLDFEDSSFCSACQCEKHIKNRLHKAMLLDDNFFGMIKPVLKGLLEIGNVGIAGMGMFFARYRLEFKRLFDELEAESENNFILSDGSPDIADKSVVIGRKIYSTENILDKVKNIIVPSVYYPQIREKVNSKNPKINVFGFFGLPFIDKIKNNN